MGLEITSFHLPCGKEEKMRLLILQDDDFHKRWPVLFPKEIKMEGRKAGTTTCFYNSSVCGGCYGTTNVKALSCFHLLWMQKNMSLQWSYDWYYFISHNYEPAPEASFQESQIKT